jgi:hypothetical protein
MFLAPLTKIAVARGDLVWGARAPTHLGTADVNRRLVVAGVSGRQFRLVASGGWLVALAVWYARNRF